MTEMTNPGSDIWGAVLRFEELTNRLERIERVARLMSSSQCISEENGSAIDGLADLIGAAREESVTCQDEFAALSKSYREAGQ